MLANAIEEAEPEGLFEPSAYLPIEWWTIFNDEQLNEFIAKALARNPTLESAKERIHLACYNSNLVRSSLFPNIVWGADVSRQKFSETGIIPFNTDQTTGQAPIAVTAGQNGIPVYFTQYETELTLNYNFDIWCRNRNLWRSALSEVQARIADEAFSRLQLSSAVALVYFHLQVNYKLRDLTRELIARKSEYLVIVEDRFEHNLENGITVNDAKNSLKQEEETLLEIESDILANEHLLKYYMADQFEEEIADTKVIEMPMPKLPMPKEIPMHVLAYRPDIVAQLWLIESAGKQIEVAKAGFYPDFNLMALFGFQTIHLHKLFLWPKSTFFNVDPAVTLPIFDGGRILANWRSSEVNYSLAILRYNDLVLNAAKEVLDGLSSLVKSHEQFQKLSQVALLQEENVQLMRLRVDHNLNSELDYLTTVEKLISAQRDQQIRLGTTYQSLLSLIKALGGGYESCCKEG